MSASRGHHGEALTRAIRVTILACTVMAAFPVRQVAQAQFGCPDDSSGVQDARCASRIAPGRLPHDQVPQFILVTFDDGINVFSESLVRPVVDDLRNPDGASAPVTYFVTRVNTTPALALERYLKGDELANHTATHTTGDTTSLIQWRSELSETNRFLVNEVGVPSDQIAGFRAPYLATNEAMWKALREYRFLYDASLPERLTIPPLVSVGPDSFAWPHTLDHGSGLYCKTNHCPDDPLPGVWSVPLWMWYDSTGGAWGAMDPAVGYDSVFTAILDYNFRQRYYGNRCPLGMYLHAGQLGLQGRREILRAFLTDKLKLPDVWMITVRGLIEWMHDPVPVTGLAEWFRQGRHRGVGRLAAAPPPSPELLEPASDTAVAAASVPLRWDVLLTASQYQLQVGTTPDLSSRLIDTVYLRGTVFDLQDLPPSSIVYWRVRAFNSAGAGAWSEVRKISTSAATSVHAEPSPAGGFRLEEGYPNPFNPSTTISFALPEATHATVRIFNTLGMEVETLVDADLDMGQHAVVWHATHVASGTYFCQLQAGSYRAMRRLVLLR